MRTYYLLFLFLFISCNDSKKTTVQISDLENHIVTQSKYWQKIKSRDDNGNYNLVATPEIINFLNIMNELDGYENKPEIVVPDKSWQEDVNQAFRSLPSKIQKLVEKWIRGIVFVKDLGGSGTAFEIKDETGKIQKIVLIFDVDAIDKNANEWCSWKESSPYKKTSLMKLKCILENEDYNNRSNAFQYIMLHELGHFVYSDYKLNFSYFKKAKSQADLDEYEITKLSWKYIAPYEGNADKHVISIFDENFPERQKIHYYTDDPEIDLNEAIKAYENLKKTNFSTMYAADNYNDDVADSFVNYVHTVMMNKPFEIQITKADDVVMSYKSCWNEKRCQVKRKIFEQLIEDQL